MLRFSALSFSLVIGLMTSVVACAARQSTSLAASPDGLSCGQRLVGGRWRVVGFVPDTTPPPAVSQSVGQLHSGLQMSFDGRQALTTGAGLHHVGPYNVTRDNGISCHIDAPDDTGVVTEVAVRFLDANHLEVMDRRSAVPGRATLERMAGP